ncbi:type I secretion C-terminal target domain-containing protein, partial [Acinetobacter sp. 187]|uniref:Ig-like domain-containing protein n=1 Tax=Acinetobacter lanii TaxID=2715163 RepID=UPI001409F7C1
SFPNSSPVTAIIEADGIWKVATPAGLKDGDEVKAIITDAAGNVSPEASEIVDGVGPTTNIDPINANDPITGTGEAGSTVTVTYPDGKTTATAEVDADGNWTVANPGLKDGDIVKAVATDPVGNVGPEATATVDGKAPNVPEIDDVVKGDEFITGESDLGTTVVITINNGATMTTQTKADGTWSIPNPGVVTGDVITAYAVDPANNASDTTSLTVHFMTEALLEAPQAYDDVNAFVGNIAQKGLTNDDRPDFTGQGAIPGAIITLYANGQAIGSTQADADGMWKITPTDALRDGPHNFTATQTDDGIESAQSPVLDFIVDTIAPEVTQADINSAGTQVIGQTESGATVYVKDAEDNILGSSVADANGTYSVILKTPVTNGDTVQVVATDKAGNSSDAVDVRDTTPPPALILDALFDDVANASELGAYNDSILKPQYSSTDSKGETSYYTNDSTPTMSGRGEPGATVSIYDGYDMINGEKVGDNLLGTVVVDADGKWSFEIPQLMDVSYRLIYRQTDSAGNAGPWSEDLVINYLAESVNDRFSSNTDSFNLEGGKFALGTGPNNPFKLIDHESIRFYGQNGVTDTSNSIHVLDAKGNVLKDVTWSTAYEGDNYMVTMKLPAGYVGAYSVVIADESFSDLAGNYNYGYQFDNTVQKPQALMADAQGEGAAGTTLVQNGWITNDNTPTWMLSTGKMTSKVLIRSTDGSYYKEVDITNQDDYQFQMDEPLSEGKHSFEFSYIYRDGAANEIQSPWSDPFTFTVDSKAYIIKGGFDNVTLDHSIYDKALYNLLVANDPTGGNKVTKIDEWTDFKVSADDSVKDTIDVSELLNLKDVNAGNVTEFLSVSYLTGDRGKHTVLSIDRDGKDGKFSSTELIVFNNVDTTLAELLKNNQIIY